VERERGALGRHERGSNGGTRISNGDRAEIAGFAPRTVVVPKSRDLHLLSSRAKSRDLHLGRECGSLDSLRTLATEHHPPFDFVFIDADKVGYPAYLEWSLRLSKPGTVIVADNIVRNGAVADAANADAAVIAVRRYNEMLAADARLTATVLQTVGSKGYDGFAIARVNG
jgi:predicted O-methyltransferase YrrM